MTQEVDKVQAQEGPQTQFLETSADIAIYGGSAGGGKTWALLLEPTRHIHNPRFGAIIFRNSYKQITMEGGLWDESMTIYPLLNAEPKVGSLSWHFPLGARVSFSYLGHEKDKLVYQGAQIPLACFDQLEQFSESQLFYILSRNRSTCGVRPYMRATCNPQPDSWLSRLLAWWIDQKTGYAIEERSGVIRWFARVSGQLVWADSREALLESYPQSLPKSLTFIRASVWDNRILLEKDPGYLANLMALPYVEQEQLAYGNWRIRAEAGNVFGRAWFGTVDAAPAEARWVRFWDLAASEKTAKSDDPDWTAGGKVALHDGIYYVGHVVRVRERWHGVRRLIVQTAQIDGKRVEIGVEQEPGASGKSLVDDIIAMPELVGYTVRGYPTRGDKVMRANPWAAQAQAGNVKLVRGGWDIQAFLDECEMFPDGPHDDQVDGISGAVQMLADRGAKEPASVRVEYDIADYRGERRGARRGERR